MAGMFDDLLSDAPNSSGLFDDLLADKPAPYRPAQDSQAASEAYAPPELTEVQKANKLNRGVAAEYMRLKEINPGASPDSLGRLATERYLQSQQPQPEPADRVQQYVDKTDPAQFSDGELIQNATRNAAFDQSLQNKNNQKYQKREADPVTGLKIAESYNPNTAAEKTAKEAKSLADSREAIVGEGVAQEMNPVLRGITKGGVQSVGLTGAAGAYVGDLIGYDDLKRYGLAVNDDASKIANQLTLSKNASDISSVDEFGDWLAENGGYVAYQAAEALLTGGLGSIAGKQVGKEAVLSAVAMGANNLRQTLGSVYADAVEEAKATGKPMPSLLQIAAGAVGSAAVDTFADKIGIDALTATGFKGNVMSRMAKSIGTQVGVQGGTEALQLIPEDLGAGKDPFREGAAKRFFDEAAVGALGGGGPGIAGGIRRAETPIAIPSAETMARDRGFLVPEKISFADPAGPASQAGITPVTIPVAPNVSTPSASTGVSARASDGGSNLAVPSVGDTGLAPTVGRGLGGTSGGDVAAVTEGGAVSQQPVQPTASVNPIARASDSDLLSRLPVESEPMTVLAGADGTGLSQGDAKLQQEAWSKRHGGAEWKIEPMANGKFRVAGYQINDATNVQNTAPAANDPEAQAAPSEAGAPVASDAATTTELSGAGSAQVQPAGVGTPATIWTGRSGAGYETIEAANQALETRTRKDPEMSWKVEQRPDGKYHLAGYATGETNGAVGSQAAQMRNANDLENSGGITGDSQATAIAGGPSGVADTTGREPAYSVKQDMGNSAAARAKAQANLDYWHGRDPNTHPKVTLGEPDQKADAQIQSAMQQTRELFGDTAASASVVAFSDPSPDSVLGFQLGDTVYVNTKGLTSNALTTGWHETHHVMQAIAEANDRDGKTNTPAQRYIAKVDSIFDTMGEKGKRQYIEQFLFKDRLAGLTGAKREAAIQRALTDPETRKEMMADFVGNRATDRGFIRSLAKADPKNFQQWAKKWLQTINDLIAELRGDGSNKQSKAVDRYVADLNKARMVVRDAMVELRNSGADMSVQDEAQEPNYKRGSGGRSNFEVAPNPDDQELSGKWNSQSEADKLQVSAKIANDIVPKVLAISGAKGRIVEQIGSFEGDTNPSFQLVLSSGDLHQISMDLGYVLSQKSMVNISTKPFAGGEKTGAIVIKLGPMGLPSVKAIYDKLQAALPSEVGGQSFAEGQMTVLNYSDTSTPELATKIFNALDGKYNVRHDEVYSSFPEEKDYTNANSRTSGRRDESLSGASIRQRLDSLRAEANSAIRAELPAYKRRGSASGRANDEGTSAPERAVRKDVQEVNLPGYPTTPAHQGPDKNLVDVARKYAESAGISLARQSQFAIADPVRGARIADAYAEMKHDPSNPAVKEAYDNLVKQTISQYKALEQAGYKFWLFGNDNDPYSTNPWNAMRELRNTKTMAVYSTTAGFGSDDSFDPSASPLLGKTGIYWPVGSLTGPKQEVLANDIFRAVHDAFGHGLEGVGFRADGEENAWQAHARLFTGSALGALTSETRGQNSWLNFGPNGESNRKAGLFDTVFADQKTGLMPEWTWVEGKVGDMPAYKRKQAEDYNDIGNINELGNFNLDADYANSTKDDFSFPDLSAADAKLDAAKPTEAEMAQRLRDEQEDAKKFKMLLARELEESGFSVVGTPKVASTKERNFAEVKPADLKRAGLMAEEAYPDLEYSKDPSDPMVDRAYFVVDGKRYRATISSSSPKIDQGAFEANAKKDAKGFMSGYELGGLSEQAKKDWNKRFAASADLIRRNFDIFTSVPAKARDNVLATWKAISQNPDAFEFGKADEAKGKNAKEVAQDIADKMMAGGRYKVKIGSPDYHRGDSDFSIMITDTKTGAEGSADVEFWMREKEVTMHTHELDKGSGMGKPVYQIGQAFADKFKARINADGILLGVNNYRRTEQMFSGMLRSGNYETMQPGVGQRIYGWNERAKTQEQQDRNMVRTALAMARNVQEFVPDIKKFGFDLATNRFYFKDKPDTTENRLMAGVEIKRILSNSDVRVASISRSTLARAAITLEAMDGKVIDASKVAEPVLYKRKEPVSDPKLERWAEGVFSRGAKPGDGVVISSTLPHEAMTMSPGTEAFGRNQPVVIEGHALGHASKHMKDGITAKMIGMLPDALKSPRMISFQAPGQMMVMLPIRTADGSPVVVILKKETMGQGRMQVKVARFSTTYPLSNSASYLVAEIKKGNRVWLPLEEVSRLQELLSGANFPSGSESPRHTSGPSISGGSTPSREAFNVLSDDALVKKQAGNKDWAKATEQIIIKDDAEKQLRGVAFKRKQVVQRAPGLPGESRFMAVRRKLQDQYIQIRELQDMLTARGGVVGEAQDVYRAEERMHGRAQELLTDFSRNQIEPFVAKAAKMGVSLDEVALYAYAKHAEERNAYIKSINSKIGDAGSGMSDAHAQNIIQMVKLAGDDQKFDELHQDLMGIASTTRRVLLDEGLITQEEYDGWENLYENYVPLRGFEDVNHETATPLRGTGRGFSMTGKESVKALGRTSKAGDILENILRDYERAVIRSEKNAVAKTFLDLATSNPDPALWEVQPVKTNRSFNKASGMVLMTNTPDTGDETIAIKVAGQQVRVKINDPLILRAMKQASKDETSQLERLLASTLGVYTNLMRNTLTRYNPIFGAINAVRDAQMGAVSAFDVLGAEGAKLYAKYLPVAMAASWRQERNKANPNGTMDKWIQEMRFAGGTTGGYHMRDTSEITEAMRTLMLQAGATPNTVGEKVRASLAYQKAAAAMKWLEIVGSTSEDAARVAAYRAARELGKTPAEAASISKNLTTNFNRKGEWGTTLNSLYLFFNAGVQGTTRVLEALGNRRVQYMMAGATAAAMALALLNAGQGDDDDGQNYWDKIPDFEKERNLIFMLPPGVEMDGANKVGTRGRYIKVPVPYGINVFPVLGNQMADLARYAKDPSQGVKPAKAGINLASAVFGSINPFGGSLDVSNFNELAMAVSPTASDLGLQLGLGINSFGRPVGPEKSPFDDKPDSENFSARQAGTASQHVARWINSVTGGNEGRSGKIDIMPGTIDNLVRNTTGGLGVFLADTFVNLPTKIASPVEVTNRDIPLLRNFYGQIDEVTDVGLFYDRRATMTKEMKAAQAEMKLGVEVDYTPESVTMQTLGKAAEGYTKWMSALRKEEIAIAADDTLTKGDKMLKRRELEKQRGELAKSFNTMYNEEMKALNTK